MQESAMTPPSTGELCRALANLTAGQRAWFWFSPEAEQGGIERTLLPIRGAKGEYASASAEKKSTDAARFARRIYGADASSISALRTKVLSISMELNKTVRATIAMRDSAEVASGVSLKG